MRCSTIYVEKRDVAGCTSFVRNERVILFHEVRLQMPPKTSSGYSAPGKSRGEMKGIQSVLTEIRKRRVKAQLDGRATTRVGYSAPHAVPVHERLDQHHAKGQAKYLEQPLRTEQKTMANIIRQRLMARESLKKAQLAAANHLMSVSIKLVPVDKGELRDSKFIK